MCNGADDGEYFLEVLLSVLIRTIVYHITCLNTYNSKKTGTHPTENSILKIAKTLIKITITFELK